jgi:hypothetical protein
MEFAYLQVFTGIEDDLVSVILAQFHAINTLYDTRHDSTIHGIRCL